MVKTILIRTGWSQTRAVWILTAALATAVNSHGLSPPEFSPASNAPVTRIIARLTTGDFNRDGHTDLVAVSQGTNLISVLPGLGGGAFGLPTEYQTLNQPGGIVVGDFNNDQKPDIALSGIGLVVMLGDGQGGFSTNLAVNTNSISSLAAADFNNDGNLDLAWIRSSVWVALGNGDGSFRVPWSFPALGTSSLLAGDFNVDGHPDLLGAGADRMVVLLNDNGTGRFLDETIYPHPYSSGIAGVALGDFNDDGRLDVVWPRGIGTVYLRFNREGVLDDLTEINLRPSGSRSLAAADFNGDGRLDLAGEGHAQGCDVLLGQGDGTFSAPLLYQHGIPLGTSPTAHVSAPDLNADGKPDLVFYGFSASSIRLRLNQSMPPLEIHQADGHVQVEWSSVFAAGFHLESTTNVFTLPDWAPMPFPPVVLGDRHYVADWSDATVKFYRLRKD